MINKLYCAIIWPGSGTPFQAVIGGLNKDKNFMFCVEQYFETNIISEGFLKYITSNENISEFISEWGSGFMLRDILKQVTAKPISEIMFIAGDDKELILDENADTFKVSRKLVIEQFRSDFFHGNKIQYFDPDFKNDTRCLLAATTYAKHKFDNINAEIKVIIKS